MFGCHKFEKIDRSYQSCRVWSKGEQQQRDAPRAMSGALHDGEALNAHGRPQHDQPRVALEAAIVHFVVAQF